MLFFQYPFVEFYIHTFSYFFFPCLPTRRRGGRKRRKQYVE